MKKQLLIMAIIAIGTLTYVSHVHSMKAPKIKVDMNNPINSDNYTKSTVAQMLMRNRMLNLFLPSENMRSLYFIENKELSTQLNLNPDNQRLYQLLKSPNFTTPLNAYVLIEYEMNIDENKIIRTPIAVYNEDGEIIAE